MNELSLFTGASGGLLGTLLLGWKHIGYVEFDDYCQQVIRQRIDDGILDSAPIFGDIRAFICKGYAEAYKGMADVITAGFPCSPFSAAGKRHGENDERNMWPETIACIRLVRPRYVLLENVPRLIASRYFGTILGDLAESGYDCRWRCLSAAELGASFIGDRAWILAEANGKRWNSLDKVVKNGRSGIPVKNFAKWESKTDNLFPSMATMVSSPISGIQRNDDGLAIGMDRLKAIGNGQVPIMVKTVWELLCP